MKLEGYGGRILGGGCVPHGEGTLVGDDRLFETVLSLLLTSLPVKPSADSEPLVISHT
jgi:hypothetical protein